MTAARSSSKVTYKHDQGCQRMPGLASGSLGLVWHLLTATCHLSHYVAGFHLRAEGPQSHQKDGLCWSTSRSTRLSAKCRSLRAHRHLPYQLHLKTRRRPKCKRHQNLLAPLAFTCALSKSLFQLSSTQDSSVIFAGLGHRSVTTANHPVLAPGRCKDTPECMIK